MHDAVLLDSEQPRAVYLSEGLGHAFVSLADASSVTYLVSTGYSPGREFGIDPMDPELDLPWPADLEFEFSAKDQAAPTLAEAQEQGLLPTMEQCAARYAELRAPAPDRSPRGGRRPARGPGAPRSPVTVTRCEASFWRAGRGAGCSPSPRP